MASFEIDPSALAPYIPSGTTLDAFDGRYFVSLVGFRFLSTRVRGVGIPFHRDFDEVNLRFYVRRQHPEGSRRGVVFIKEIVPRRAIAWVANVVYDENYVALPMRHELSDERVRYGWKFGPRWSHVEMSLRDELYLPEADSEEAFITEHYWGYAARTDGTAVEYQVEHPRWHVRRASTCSLEGNFESLYGRELGATLGATPCSAFVADGSAVRVLEGERI